MSLAKAYSVYLKQLIDNELKPSIDELRTIINDELKPLVNEQTAFKDALLENLQVENITVDELGNELKEVLYGITPMTISSTTINDVSINGGNDGSIIIVVIDGKAPYKYKLYNSNNELVEETMTIENLTYTFTDLIANTYYIIVEDGDNPKTIKTSDNLTMNEPPPPPQELFEAPILTSGSFDTLYNTYSFMVGSKTYEQITLRYYYEGGTAGNGITFRGGRDANGDISFYARFIDPNNVWLYNQTTIIRNEPNPINKVAIVYDHLAETFNLYVDDVKEFELNLAHNPLSLITDYINITVPLDAFYYAYRQLTNDDISYFNSLLN